MGLDPLSLTMIGISALSSVMQVSGAQDQAKASAEAASRNAESAYKEAGFRQQEAIDKASEDKSDRASQADRELATLRVIAGETGGLGTVNFTRQVGEVGAMEGIDVARIESNRDREIASLQRSKDAAQAGASSAIKSASMSASNAATSGALNFASSGLQIYTGAQRHEAYVKAAQNKVR